MIAEMEIIKAICDDEDIHLFILPESTFEFFEKTAGIVIQTKDAIAIFIRDDLGKWQTVEVAAHEIGHVLQGHLSPKNEDTAEEKEEEARMFAAAFLALSVMKKYGGGDSNA